MLAKFCTLAIALGCMVSTSVAQAAPAPLSDSAGLAECIEQQCASEFAAYGWSQETKGGRKRQVTGLMACSMYNACACPCYAPTDTTATNGCTDATSTSALYNAMATIGFCAVDGSTVSPTVGGTTGLHSGTNGLFTEDINAPTLTGAAAGTEAATAAPVVQSSATSTSIVSIGLALAGAFLAASVSFVH